MDFFQSPGPRNPSKRNKKRLTRDQVSLLETSFNYNKKLEPDRKIQLAVQLGLPPRQVAVWYQNKRARWKTQSLELDYKALQLRLDNVLEEKRRLEKEVVRLRRELEKAQEMMLSWKPAPPPVLSVSTSCDEEGSPCLPGNGNCCWENSGVLQVEELYACLMDGEGQAAKLNGQLPLFNPCLESSKRT